MCETVSSWAKQMRYDPDRQSPSSISDRVLTFVQECQVAILACSTEDYMSQVVALWNCLDSFPLVRTPQDQRAAAIAVSRVADGFWSPSRRNDYNKLRPARASRRRKHVNDVLQIAHKRYSEVHLTLALLARELHLSHEFLSRALSAETGHTLKGLFRRHLNGIRLMAAIRLLKSEDLSCTDIARRVGYSRPGELDRQFDRWFKLTPSQFRRILREAPTSCFDR